MFAPSNDAFDSLAAGEIDTLVKPSNRDQLRDFVERHVVAGYITSNELKVLSEIKTINGHTYVITGTEEEMTVGGARIELYDLEASNGVVHIVSTIFQESD